VTGQLLGHVVVEVPGSSSSSSRRKVLLVLVPEGQLSRVSEPIAVNSSTNNSSSSSSMMDASRKQQQQPQECRVTGMAAVIAALLLPTVRQFDCVMLTEAEWQGWAAEGGQQQQEAALLQLLQQQAGV
jgi:hypothetical protein